MSKYFFKLAKRNQLKWFLFLFSFILLVSLVSAIAVSETSGLPSQKQGSIVFIIQGCDNSTYSNISSVIVGSNVLIGTTVMPNVSSDYYQYNFTDTSNLGTYVVSGYCDESGIKKNWVYDFDVTPTGADSNPNFFYFALILSLGLILLGMLVFKNAPITILGSFGLIYVGLYILLNGINGVKDTVYTWGWGIIILAVAGYVGIKSAYEMIVDS